MRLEFGILLGLHLAGFALWTGFLAAFLLLGDSSGRLLRFCLLAMPVTLIAGWALAFVQYGGPGAWPWAVNAMQTTGLAMAVVLLVIRFGAMLLLRDAEAQRDAGMVAPALRRVTRLVALDLALGVLATGFAVAGYCG